MSRQSNEVVDLASKRTKKNHDVFNDILENVDVPILERYLEQFGITKEYKEYMEFQKEMSIFIENVMILIKVNNAMLQSSVNDKALKSLELYKSKLNEYILKLNKLIKKVDSTVVQIDEQYKNQI